MQTVVSKSQFKAQALEYFREIEKNKQPIVVTHAGKPVVKIIPYQEEERDKAILASLRGSVLKYEDPDEPAIDPEDWDALR